jgi:hypothetical protein
MSTISPGELHELLFAPLGKAEARVTAQAASELIDALAGSAGSGEQGAERNAMDLLVGLRLDVDAALKQLSVPRRGAQ